MSASKGTSAQKHLAVRNKPRTEGPAYHYVNTRYLEEISPGNTTFFETAMNLFRDSSVRFLGQAKSALASRDFIALARYAHQMKPSGSYIGAVDFTKLVTTLEQAAREQNANVVKDTIGEIQQMIDKILVEINLYLASLYSSKTQFSS